MIDVSNNIASALSLSYRNNRLPSSVALVKPAANEAGTNSVRAIANDYRAANDIKDFSPPSQSEQGFASLSTALESVRIPPAALAATAPDSAPTWERLLAEQEKIADARVARQDKFAEIQQLREDDAARRAANEERARQIREAIVLNQSSANETSQAAVDDSPERLSRLAEQANAIASQPTAAALSDGNDANENIVNLPGDSQNQSATEAEQVITVDLPGSNAGEAVAEQQTGSEINIFPPASDNSNDASEVYSAEQERLSRLFFGNGNGNPPALNETGSFNQFA